VALRTVAAVGTLSRDVRDIVNRMTEYGRRTTDKG
jgi:hypothetical protein